MDWTRLYYDNCKTYGLIGGEIMFFADIVPWIISSAMFTVALITLVRNVGNDRRKEEREDESALLSIKEGLLKANLKLDSVCATTNETRTDIKSLNNDISTLDRRVTVVERDVKTVYSYIDDLKNTGKGE